MTRILSYNILVGGARRVNELTSIIKSAQPDIVGLVEATDAKVVEELAERLGMQSVLSAKARHARNGDIALLSRLPIVHTQVHICRGILTAPVLEVCVEEEDGQQLTLFVTHLAAAFNKGWAGEAIRRREVREILRIMSGKQGRPHVLMGDFNALAPGDPFKASHLLGHIVNLEQRRRQSCAVMEGQPHLNFIVPKPLRVFKPLLRLIPKSKLLCNLFDAAASLYAPRGTIGFLCSAGYIDCFRCMNPDGWGFTCPALAPAGRIDFIFASPEVGERLSTCYIATEGEGGVAGDEASDHLAVVAEFVCSDSSPLCGSQSIVRNLV